MKDIFKVLILVFIVIGFIALAGHVFRETYKPAESGPTSGQNIKESPRSRIPLTCAVVVSESLRKRGTEIPGLNVGAAPSPLPLLRPVGESLSQALVGACKNKFMDVKFMQEKRSAGEADIVIELMDWQFADKDTGYEFKGLPVLVAAGKGYTTLEAELEVTGPRFSTFRVQDIVRGTRDLGITLFPVSRLSRTMTEATDIAASSIAKNLVGRIVRDKRMRTLKVEIEKKETGSETERFEAVRTPQKSLSSRPSSLKEKVIRRDGPYVAYSNGIVRDTDTGLEWKVGPDKTTSWDEARSWVENLDLDGGNWRMPTVEELEHLYKRGAGNRNMTPLLETSGWWVWAGGTMLSSDAFGFGFGSGMGGWRSRDSSGGRAFAVRSQDEG